MDKEASMPHSTVFGLSGLHSYSFIWLRYCFSLRMCFLGLQMKLIQMKILLLCTVAASVLSGCFVEADKLLLAMGDTLFAAVYSCCGLPSITLKRWPPVHCMAGWVKSPPPMLASIMAVGSLQFWMSMLRFQHKLLLDSSVVLIFPFLCFGTLLLCIIDSRELCPISIRCISINMKYKIMVRYAKMTPNV
jgi:hypothetical protein